MTRGVLRVYLGAASGVGKTFAMLSEGMRRSDRGTETVIGSLRATRRQPIIALASRLEDLSLEGLLDVKALRDRRPAVALVDELAGPPSTTGPNKHRWQDVDDLLEAGCDVVTTLDIDELESLADVAQRITRVTPIWTVPDRFVRAGQIELVDMAPESLRRRLAHGNVFSPEEVDAKLADYFRVGNLAALRELALSWLADRVEETLTEYVSAHAIDETWETRERIVVALTGATTGERVIRRAGRIAARSRAALIGVHVIPENGMTSRAGPYLERQRAALESLGGTYNEIVGDDIARSLVAFAETERATQLVVGVEAPNKSGHRPSSLANAILRQVTELDVHVITSPSTSPAARRSPRDRASRLAVRRRSSVSRQRETIAWLMLLVGLPLLTLTLRRFPNHAGLSAVLLLFLAFVLATATVGGFAPGIAAAVIAFLLSNWFFVPPRHTFAISSAENYVALIVFVAVGVTVSFLVDRVSRRSRDALLARAEAEVLARTTATIAGERDPLDHLMEQLNTTFGATGTALLSRHPAGWHTEANHGKHAPTSPDDGLAIPLDDSKNAFVVLAGTALTADDHRVLRTIASQLRLALDARHYQESTARLDALAEANTVRTAMLQAVSHDLRTPLAAIKASSSSLLSTEVDWPETVRRELLQTIEDEADRLNRIVGNLLDMSRLQAGGVSVHRRPVGVDEIVETALSNVSGIEADRQIDVSIGDGLEADVDAALVERALANVISNALLWAPVDERIRIEAVEIRGSVHLRVIDRGPGIPAAQRGRVFEPFQRLGDRGGAGVGLGLAVTRGLITATSGRVELDDTPGGGLTVTLLLPGRTAPSGAQARP